MTNQIGLKWFYPIIIGCLTIRLSSTDNAKLVRPIDQRIRFMTNTNGHKEQPTPEQDQVMLNRGLAQMLKGGVIMDVVTPEQAKIAEDAGACAVMALERVPADIRAQGGVARMSDPDMIDGIVAAVSIPVMAKARIGHFVEARVLQSLGVDYI